jgi:hypothetical protein
MSERKNIKVSIATTDRTEVLVADYLNNSNRTKQLSISALTAYYLPLAMLKDKNSHSDTEVLEAVCDSVSQLKAQIEKILLTAQVHGLDLPKGMYGNSVVIEESSEAKQHSRNSKAKLLATREDTVVADDEDYHSFVAPPNTIEFRLDN